MHACTSVPVEARRGFEIPWSWNYKLWSTTHVSWELNLSLLNPWAISKGPVWKFTMDRTLHFQYGSPSLLWAHLSLPFKIFLECSPISSPHISLLLHLQKYSALSHSGACLPILSLSWSMELLSLSYSNSLIHKAFRSSFLKRFIFMFLRLFLHTWVCTVSNLVPTQARRTGPGTAVWDGCELLSGC